MLEVNDGKSQGWTMGRRRRRRLGGEACDALVCNVSTFGFLWAILAARSNGQLGCMALEPRRAVYT